jgi:hypothetical protein
VRALLALLLIPVLSLAQAPLTTEFPAESTTLADDKLRQRVSGKVFKVKPADGTTWRLEFKDSGYSFLDTSRGYRDSGKWRVENSQLCIDWQRAASGCSDARLKDEVLFIKRTSNGEVVALQAD